MWLDLESAAERKRADSRPGAPVNQKDLAQRQLAELRLRRHGFGE